MGKIMIASIHLSVYPFFALHPVRLSVHTINYAFNLSNGMGFSVFENTLSGHIVQNPNIILEERPSIPHRSK